MSWAYCFSMKRQRKLHSNPVFKMKVLWCFGYFVVIVLGGCDCNFFFTESYYPLAYLKFLNILLSLLILIIQCIILLLSSFATQP